MAQNSVLLNNSKSEVLLSNSPNHHNSLIPLSTSTKPAATNLELLFDSDLSFSLSHEKILQNESTIFIARPQKSDPRTHLFP